MEACQGHMGSISLANRLSLWTLMLQLVLSLMAASASNPGLKLRVSQSGLNYAAVIALDVLRNKLINMRLDIHDSGRHSWAIGDTEWNTNNYKVVDFWNQNTWVTMRPGEGVTWSANANIHIRGEWSYNTNIAWGLRVRDGGSVDVRVHNIRLDVTVTVGASSSGKPQLRVTGYTCNTGDIDLRINNNNNWFYNIILAIIRGDAVRHVKDAVCHNARQAIDSNGAAQLSTLRTQVPMFDNWMLDYRLTSAPVFTSHYMESSHSFKLLHRNSQISGQLPVPPMVTRFEGTAGRMMSFIVSDYILDNLGHVLHHSGILSHTLTMNDLQSPYRAFLDLSCCHTCQCIGNYLPPGILEAYGELNSNASSFEVLLRTTSPPTARIAGDQVEGQFTGLLTVQLKTRSSSSSNSQAPLYVSRNLLQLNVSLQVAVELTFDGSSVRVTVQYMNADVGLDTDPANSEVARLILSEEWLDSDLMLNALANSIIRIYAIPKLNEVGAVGIKWPQMDFMHAVSPDFRLDSNNAVFSTNVEYRY